MRTVVQRVSEAAVSVDGAEIARIDRGYLVLAGFSRDDTDVALEWMARRIATLRVFEDQDGRMSRSLESIDGHVLVLSQFTLYGDCSKGRRPSWDDSAPADLAHALYDRFVDMLEAAIPGRVATGEFQAKMDVSLVNDGPVTLVIEK